MVILQHFGGMIAPKGIRDLLVPLALGNIAVMVFFVLSGFIISEAAATFYRQRPGPFLFNRCLRIVPPFLAAITVSILVHWVMMRSHGAWSLEPSHPNMLQPDIFTLESMFRNYLSLLPGAKILASEEDYFFIPYIWAVRAEVCFYLTVFVSLFLARKHPARLEWILVIAGFGSMTMFGLRYLAKAPELFQYTPYFVLGVAVYFRISGSRIAGWIAVGAVLAIAVQFSTYDAGSPLAAEYNRAAQVGILAAAIIALITLADFRFDRAREADRFLGDLSYSVYLNHYVVGVVFYSTLEEHTMSTFGLAIAASLVYSYAMYLLVEPGFRALRNRVRGRRVDPPVDPRGRARNTGFKFLSSKGSSTPRPSDDSTAPR
jgi:peptidoglycan/LPS O-acetylase OafA/YrhL